MAEEPEAIVARELVERIHSGDAGAEHELYLRYGPPVMRMLQALTRNRWFAEDTHQETFAIVLRRLRRRPLDDPAALGHFLRQTARKLVMASNRKKRRREETEIGGAALEEFIDPEPGQLVRVIRKEERDFVHRALQRIEPVRYRQLLLRFYLHEEAKESICREMGLTAVHFNRVLFRARRSFLRAVARRRS
ncbi:MAG TPA: sigma-70 family RNA polymerase sigma factor [Thermoanaerobaculia bacterium]|nr:sigma-70 family RNA polymerase sigma factor [Thermoanaerobaculia bacterium]